MVRPTFLLSGLALMLGNVVSAEKMEGKFFVERDDGTQHGCMKDNLHWTADESACGTFTIDDHGHTDHSRFTVSFGGNYCRLSWTPSMQCIPKVRKAATWSSRGPIHEAGSYLRSDGWVAGGKDNFYAHQEPHHGKEEQVYGYLKNKDHRVRIHLRWEPTAF